MRALTRIALRIAGWAVVAFGLLGLVLPLHPGLLFILLGLGILSVVSPWAGRAREWLLDRLDRDDVDNERLRRWRERIDDWLPEAAHEREDGDE